jgi:hypothetical protein
VLVQSSQTENDQIPEALSDKISFVVAAILLAPLGVTRFVRPNFTPVGSQPS